MSIVGTLEEPAGRSVTGPFAWEQKRAWRLLDFPDPPIQRYQELQGMAWTCPSCGRAGVVMLRKRDPNRFWFACSECKWTENFNHVRALEILDSVGAPAPA